jgi:hypothetical protein
MRKREGFKVLSVSEYGFHEVMDAARVKNIQISLNHAVFQYCESSLNCEIWESKHCFCG